MATSYQLSSPPMECGRDCVTGTSVGVRGTKSVAEYSTEGPLAVYVLGFCPPDPHTEENLERISLKSFSF
jgi:hypothetical protein